MTLSNSRQQFLAYEGQAPDDIHYGRKGGVFVTTCVCVSLVILAVVLAALVGVIVYYITYFKVAHNNNEFWDDGDPFSFDTQFSPNLRLPSSIVPNYYRIKIRADLNKSTFTGDVSISLKANKPVNQIILHSKDLIINANARLTAQVYENLEISHVANRFKRDAENNTESVANNTSETVAIDKDHKGEKKDIATNKPADTTEKKAEIDTVTKQPEILPETVAPDISTSKTANLSTEHIDLRTPSPVINNENTTLTTSLPIFTTSTIENNKTESPQTTDNQVFHINSKNMKILSITKGDGDRLIIELDTMLKTGLDYILELSFDGNISSTLTGFYKSSYNTNGETRQLAVTQMEPISARSAFPCFDEPEFKAKMEISIAHHKNYSALSNMKIASIEEMIDNKNWQWTHFERSVDMSTYLVAYMLSDFQHHRTNYQSKDNLTKNISVWARPELINNTKYALSIAKELLQYYEEVFGLPYALDKLDLVAVPDFASGAMENWGLLTFRETALVYDENTNVPRDKQTVAIDVAHELAHQWFGNLVTMKWWTDLWLNEGFATYIEYVGVNKIEPKWNMLELLTKDKMDLLRLDALKNTSPVSRQVVDASEIAQKFDEISYSKGASLIRMLNHTISEKLFSKGLALYLNEWKYRNAEENDLWRSMESACKSDAKFDDFSLVDMMNSWTRQAGYPLLFANRNYTTGEVVFEQSLFTTSKQPYKKTVDQLWHIPISYAHVGSEPWSTEPKVLMTGHTVSVPLNMSDKDALYVNVDAIGYYRVNYDINNWMLLKENFKIYPPITRAQLLDDSFNIAKVGFLEYNFVLNLTTWLVGAQEEKIVWDLLLTNMAFLKHNLKATPGYVYFQDFMNVLLKRQLEAINYGLNPPKDDNEALLIENLLLWECHMQNERCLKWANDEFHKWMESGDLKNNSIPSYLRSVVYSIALKHGGRREFEFLWKVYLHSSDPVVINLIMNSLASTGDETLITLLLERSLTDIPKQYAVSVWNVESIAGSKIAQDFLINNWQRVYDTFTQIDSFMFGGVLNGAFGGVNTQTDLDKLKSMALAHKSDLMPMSQTLQKLIDSAILKINWIAKFSKPIENWLKGYFNGTGTANNETKVHTATRESKTTLPTIQSDTTRTVFNISKDEIARNVPSSVEPTDQHSDGGNPS